MVCGFHINATYHIHLKSHHVTHVIVLFCFFSTSLSGTVEMKLPIFVKGC